MYEKFRNAVLVELKDLPSDILKKVSDAMDKVSCGYTVAKSETGIAVIGREHFKQIAGAYLITRKTEGLAASSLAQMARILNNFILSMTKPIEKLQPNDIRSYLYTYQQERKITNRSLDLIRTILCTFFRWSAAEGYIPADPTANIKPIKYTRKPRKALTQVELEKVRRACKTERETSLVETLYSTGCRVSELCSIKLMDVNWSNNSIMVLGKGGKYREVYLNAKSIISLQAYLGTRKHKSDYLFCNERGGGKMSKANVEKIFARIEQETGVFVTPHIMRHTFATQALTGTGVEIVQKMLGHSSIATTMIYAEVDHKSVQTAHIKCVI